MTVAVGHVVVFVQENHTTDNYFRSMRAWGANVAADWPVQPNPPAKDQPHTRAAYAKWLHAQQAATRTPGHPHPIRHHCRAALLRLPRRDWSVPGEPLLRVRHELDPQPPAARRGADPDLAQPTPHPDPTGVGHALAAGTRWRTRLGLEGLHRQLLLSSGLLQAATGLPEHRAQRPDRRRRRSSAAAEHGVARQPLRRAPDSRTSPMARTRSGRPSTPSRPPDTGTTPCSCSPGTTGAATTTMSPRRTSNTPPTRCNSPTGPGYPLLMFGGQVRPGIDSRWSSHVSIGKTVLDLLGLPPLGVPRLDDAPSLTDLINPQASSPQTTRLRHHHHPTHTTTTDPDPRPHTPTASQHIDTCRAGNPTRRLTAAPTQRPTRHLTHHGTCSRLRPFPGRPQAVKSFPALCRTISEQEPRNVAAHPVSSQPFHLRFMTACTASRIQPFPFE